MPTVIDLPTPGGDDDVWAQKLNTAITAVRDAADAAAGAGGFPADTQLTAASDELYDATVVDDGTPTGSWPNRISHFFKPVAGLAQLVTWFNEYFEFRAMCAKVNTVAVRIFSKDKASDPAHVGNVFEIHRSREARDLVFGVDGEGNVAAEGDLTAAGDITATGAVTGSNIGPLLQVIPNGGAPDPIPGSVVVELNA